MRRAWLLDLSALFLFVGVSNTAARRCLGVTGSNGSWLSIRVCASSWRKRLTKDRLMTALLCALCLMRSCKAIPLKAFWPMPSLTVNATTDTSASRLEPRVLFRPSEVSQVGSFAECVLKCVPLSPQSAIDSASMLKQSLARSNANSRPKPRVVRSRPNANKLSCWAWPTTFTNCGHPNFDFFSIRELFNRAKCLLRDKQRRPVADLFWRVVSLPVAMVASENTGFFSWSAYGFSNCRHVSNETVQLAPHSSRAG